MTDIPAQKAALRQSLRSFRKAIPDDARKAAAAAIVLHGAPLAIGAARFAGYMPTGSEIDCRPLAEALRAAGLAELLPVLQPDLSLSFRPWPAGAPLRIGGYGIPEPDSDTPYEQPDFVLVPLLGFDGRGFRLGQGGGHYDRALARLPLACRFIGVGFAGQRTETLPIESHDRPLDAVLTEAGLLYFRG